MVSARDPDNPGLIETILNFNKETTGECYLHNPT